MQWLRRGYTRLIAGGRGGYVKLFALFVPGLVPRQKLCMPAEFMVDNTHDTRQLYTPRLQICITLKTCHTIDPVATAFC
jgi:hypothetical protein